MGTARKIDEAKISMRVSPELHDQISAKAEAMNLDFDQTVAVLLRFGLEVQAQREEKLARLVTEYRSSKNPDKKERLGDELGGAIFGM